MRSTMQDGALLLSGLVRYGQQMHGDARLTTAWPDGYRTATFAEIAERAERLAAALARLGVGRGDRVATFAWNNQTHMEAYLAVPSMGAVLHTLNVRLFPEQLAYVIDHAEDKVVLVDGSLVPLLARVYGERKSVEHVIVVGEGDATPLGETLDYEQLLAAEEPGYAWPEDLDEREAAAMCYTSGTTGDPKGVVYSHRSTYLHTMSVTSVASVGFDEGDKVLVIVPMFHVNAWGVPYAAWMIGADLLMPQMLLMGEPLAKVITEQRPTVACGVPTIWNDLLRVAREPGVDLSSLRQVTAGGSAVPRALIEAFDALGITMVQGWGMTETSPVAALALPPPGLSPEEAMEYRSTAGRIVPGVEARLVAEDGRILPHDGVSAGELEVRGPWVTGSYYKEPSQDRFHHGWLRTGDIGTIDPQGYLRLTDRTKDVIKSGGEWISSVELENHVMADPDVYEAAVIAVPDPKWQERPLVCVVPEPGHALDPNQLVAFLRGRVARWWVPERWAVVPDIPKTSVGKFDKKVLRARHAAGELDVMTVDVSPPEG